MLRTLTRWQRGVSAFTWRPLHGAGNLRPRRFVHGRRGGKEGQQQVPEPTPKRPRLTESSGSGMVEEKRLFEEVCSTDLLGFSFGGRSYQAQLTEAIAKTKVGLEVRDVE